ncbi:hypothetical protein MTR_2g063930 [Medicago truncatula]|uniref:protein-serine/threonine phosphatase n=1 Tax=Medicago truncatula TaxID=3880 RepID=A0A072V9A3_MEDTR|nr:hypothetical protein MTR_2g063930 [Medicago truncatula]
MAAPGPPFLAGAPPLHSHRRIQHHSFSSFIDIATDLVCWMACDFPEITDSSDSTDEYVDYVEAAIQISVILDEEAEKQHELEVSSENKASTSEGTVEQKLGTFDRFSCFFIFFARNKHGRTPRPLEQGVVLSCEFAAMEMEYLNHGLRLHDEEISRVRSLHTRNLLNRRKLCLVLDLDHTQINTTSLHPLNPKEMQLKTYTDSLEVNKIPRCIQHNVCQF